MSTALIKNYSLNCALNLPNLFLKLEEANPYQSHKYRSLGLQIPYHIANNSAKIFALSSTGNAAIAANMLAQQYNTKIITFISQSISSEKLKLLRTITPYLIFSERPYPFLNYLQKNLGATILNATYDPLSIKAYREIGYELYHQCPQLDEIVVFVSSGSTYLGIGEAYVSLLEKKVISKLPILSMVQCVTMNVPGLYRSSVLLAGGGGCIKTRFKRRQEELKEMLVKFEGRVLSIDDHDILDTRDILVQHGQDTSPEGCAVLGGVLRYRDEYEQRTVACLFTGAAEQWHREGGGKSLYDVIPICTNIHELKEILSLFGF